MATSTAEFQDAEEAANAVGDVSTELNAAEDAIEEGDYPAAQIMLAAQIDNLTSILEWVTTQIPVTGENIE